MKSSSWQGKEIRGMIRSLAVNCAPILDCCKNDGKTPAETASDEMVMGAVRALWEFSLLVSQQNHSDLSLTALDDALNRFYKKKGGFREQKMAMSGTAQADELLARESHQLWEQNIHKILGAMEVQVYGAEMDTTTKRRQFQVLLNRARQASTIWSDADRERAIERFEGEIYQVTPAKRNLFDKSFQHHKQPPLQEVGTKATGPRSTFAQKLAQMNTAAGEEVYGAANETANKRVEFQVRLSDAETEATTLSVADTDCIANQLEREIYGVTSNEQLCFKMEFSIHLIKFEAWWQALGVQELQKTIQQRVIQRCILWAIYHCQFGEWVLVTISPLIFLNSYISPMWKRHIDLQMKSITFDRCWSTMTSVPVLTIWRRLCLILPSKAGTILTLQKFATYYLLPINGEILAVPIFYLFSIVRQSHFSTTYHNRYIIWENPLFMACAEVSNWPHSEMLQTI